jgi:D-alanyl-D-alanine carboxypeptidase
MTPICLGFHSRAKAVKSPSFAVSSDLTCSIEIPSVTFQTASRASVLRSSSRKCHIGGKPLFTPGKKYRYSNSDNIAVALMVEAATGKTYEDQLRKQVYAPLGLRKTSLPSGTQLRTPFIHGYDLSEQPPEDVSKITAAGWAWASGGIVSTPADLNTFIRGYVKGKLYDLQTRAQQRKVFDGGRSDPPGPGKNSAGLGIFRYVKKCGTVWGHTGNIFGYTQFMAASPYGKRSATVSINAQITPTMGDPDAFKVLRRAEGFAVCAALTGKG